MSDRMRITGRDANLISRDTIKKMKRRGAPQTDIDFAEETQYSVNARDAVIRREYIMRHNSSKFIQILIISAQEIDHLNILGKCFPLVVDLYGWILNQFIFIHCAICLFWVKEFYNNYCKILLRDLCYFKR